MADLSGQAPRVRGRTHWSVYLPTLVIVLGWGGVLLWAELHRPALETLRQLALVIEGAGVPLLLVSAWQRARRTGLVVTGTRFRASAGWLRAHYLEGDIADVVSMSVRQSGLQKKLGAGSIDIRLRDGRVLSLDDIASPESVVRDIRRPAPMSSA